MNSMYRLLDSYDRANTEPKNDLRFAFDIYNLFNDIRERVMILGRTPRFIWRKWVMSIYYLT
jgi:hypothetical protein